MNDVYKAFISSVARDLGTTPNEVAFECIAATMNLPSMAKYSGGKPPPCRFGIPVVAPEAVTVVTADTSALEAEILSLKAEVESLRAAVASAPAVENALDNIRSAPAPAAAPKAPKAPKAAVSPSSNLSDGGNLKTVVIDGTETPVRSWRAGAMHMLGLLTAAGQKADVPTGWFRDEASDRTVTLPSGDHAFASIVTGDCEKRIRKVAEVLSVNVTLRIVAEDGTSQDVAL